MVAVYVVSESELNKVMQWDCTYPEKEPKKFMQLLFDLGLDTTKPFEFQEPIFHRNRLNEVVFCARWVGCERYDQEWIKSGYASQEAKNEASGSQMVKDLDPHRYYKW